MPRTIHFPLSVVIISLNEERRIGDCLESVRGLADDVVVVDAHSRDCTCEICRARGARVFQRPWAGFSEQKNFGNAQARHDWILSLDADERVSAELTRSIRAELTRGPGCNAYAIRFENYFGSRRIRFGAWNPEWHVRLFDRRRLEWNSQDVHEGLHAKGAVRTGRLHGCIRHFTVESSAQLAEKTDRYSTLFSHHARRRARAPHVGKIWLNPAWRFVRDYVVRLGVLDGEPGAIIAWEAARYTHLKYAKARPPARPRRPLNRLASIGACALLAFAIVRLTDPWPRWSNPPGVPQYMAAADDDEDYVLLTLSPDADDDVIV